MLNVLGIICSSWVDILFVADQLTRIMLKYLLRFSLISFVCLSHVLCHACGLPFRLPLSLLLFAYFVQELDFLRKIQFFELIFVQIYSFKRLKFIFSYSKGFFTLSDLFFKGLENYGITKFLECFEAKGIAKNADQKSSKHLKALGFCR